MSDRRLGNAALAKAVGISHVAIGNYLDGRLPRAEELLALADHFGVSTDYLLGRDGVAPRLPAVPAGPPVRDLGDPETGCVSSVRLEAALVELDGLQARCVEAGELLERAVADIARIRSDLAPDTGAAPTARPRGSAGRTGRPAQSVSVKDSLPGVEAAVKDRVRDGSLRAMRLSRGKGSPDKG